jgi:hypothetical protein
MYGSIRRYRVKSNNVDEVINRVKSGLLPLLEKTPGFVGYYTLGPHDGKVTSFTVCENQVAIDQVNRTALDWVKHTLPNDLSEPEVIAGELTISLMHQHAVTR